MTKPKKCAICKELFIPARPLQKVCGFECAKAHAAKVSERTAKSLARADRQETRERKEALKTKRDYTKEAQIAFNAFIRERDRDSTCICCGLRLSSDSIQTTGGVFDCGHYRSVGSAPHLRFDERNAHGQRKQCNRWGAGRAVDYRLGLINRIGLQAVESLEADQTPKHYTIDELKAITAHYRAKLKQLKSIL